MAKKLNPQWLVDRHPSDLKAQVRYLITKGFQVTSQDSHSAQLLKKKKFSCLFCLITGVVPYFIWYMAKRDRLIFLDAEVQKPTPPKQQGWFMKAFGETYDEIGPVGVIVAILVIMFVISYIQVLTEK